MKTKLIFNFIEDIIFILFAIVISVVGLILNFCVQIKILIIVFLMFLIACGIMFIYHDIQWYNYLNKINKGEYK